MVDDFPALIPISTKKKRSVQGQGPTTIEKERRISSMLTTAMMSLRYKLLKFPYWYFDANAGSGWNDEIDVEGSPIVFAKCVANEPRPIRPNAFFAEKDFLKAQQLNERLNSLRELANFHVINKDNSIVLNEFCEAIHRSREIAELVIGAVLFDPNGYFYRNAGGIGVPPLKDLEDFFAEFKKIDVMLCLNARAFHMQRSQHQDVMPPQEIMSFLRKEYWRIGRSTRGQGRFIQMIGANVDFGDHKRIGLYKANSTEGQEILSKFVVEKPSKDDDWQDWPVFNGSDKC